MEPLRFRSLLAKNWRTLQPECWFLYNRWRLLMEHRRRRLLMNECYAVGQWITDHPHPLPRFPGKPSNCTQTLTLERFAPRCWIKHKVRVNADTLWQLFDNNSRRTNNKRHGELWKGRQETGPHDSPTQSSIKFFASYFPAVFCKTCHESPANIQNMQMPQG